jgi:hypothetical protein
MSMGKPASFVRAFLDAVDDAIRAHQPHHGMSAMPRAWLAFWVTAVVVTHAMCWARFARARLGTYALAALSWMFRHSKMPWDDLLVASVRVLLHHQGITAGSLLSDATDTPRSKAAHPLAPLYKLRDTESGGYLGGQRLVFLVVVTPTISLPVGCTFYQPAPELSAWDKQEKALKKPGIPTPPRLPQPPPHPRSPTQPQLALRWLAQGTMDHPGIRGHWIVADALSGTAPCVAGASALFGGVPGISQARSHQHIQGQQREQHLTDSLAAHPGTPQPLRLRGGDERVAMGRSARFFVCAHQTKRCIVALKDEEEET